MYGRAGDLAKLNRDRNNPALSKFVRQQADKAHAKITAQMKDRKLMRLREQLINAVRGRDLLTSAKIEQQMRAHAKEDQETGI